jgi:hypothetical protein
MKILFASFFICLVITGAAIFVKTSNAQAKTSDCACVADALKDAQKLKAGSTRKEALENFMEEGGISTVTTRSYVYRKCPYIKIALTFDAVDKSKSPRENSEDKIATISRPYLEYGIID